MPAERLPVACPYCGEVTEVLVAVAPKVERGWGPHVLFMTAQFSYLGGMEHHCAVLRKAIEDRRQPADKGGSR